jgi:hypothetical protein
LTCEIPGRFGAERQPYEKADGEDELERERMVYAREEERVPVPLRMRFAASWPMPMKSWTPEVVRQRTSTGQTSAAKPDEILRNAPRASPLMSYIPLAEFWEGWKVGRTLPAIKTPGCPANICTRPQRY